MKKRGIRMFAGAMLAVLVAALSGTARAVDIQSIPEPGKWCSVFAATKEMAEARHMPMLLIYSRASCGNCQRLKAAVSETDFLVWQDLRKIAMCYSVETVDDYRDAHAFANLPNSLPELPLVSLYWKKPDGSVLRTNFMGHNGTMLVPATGLSLGEQLMKSVDQYFAEYFSRSASGVGFGVTDTDYDRLEVVVGETRPVGMPLTREKSEKAGKTYLRCGNGVTVVEWKAGESRKNAVIEVSAKGLKAGKTVEVVHADEAAEAVLPVHVVKAPANAVSNPKWIGESFDFGEWTMDYDAAKRKGGYTLALFSGTLWCPYCYGLETSLLASAKFRNWAKKNRVNLVLFDQGEASSPATAAGTPFCRLLTCDGAVDHIDGSFRSGASYLSRRGIDPDSSTVKSVIDRVTKLTSEWRAPGSTSARLGNPTLLIVKNDKVVGRFNGLRNADKSYDVDENLNRLTDLLALADVKDDETDGYLATSGLALSLGASESVEMQINDRTKWFRLEGPFDEYVRVDCAADKDVMLTATDAAGNEIASASRRLIFARPASGALYLKASCYAEAVKYGKKTTCFPATLSLSTGGEEFAKTLDFAEVTKQEAKAANAFTYAKSSVQVPLLADLGGVSVLAGTLDVTVTAANKITAKYQGTEARAQSFSGTWAEMNGLSGAVRTTLRGGTAALALELDASGVFSATLSGTASAFEGPFSGAAAVVQGQALTPFVGIYSVALPFADETAVGTCCTGAGTLTFTVTAAAARTGKISCKFVLPNGTSLSANGWLFADVDGTAKLVVFKRTSKDVVGFALTLEPGAGARSVFEADGTLGYVLHTGVAVEDAHLLRAFGDGIPKGATPLQLCEGFDRASEFLLSFDVNRLTPGDQGAIEPIGEVAVVAAKNAFAPVEKGAVTLTYAKATGLIGGKVKVFFTESAKSVQGSIRAVVTPGWHDCHCGEEPVEERPFAMGTLFFKDKVGGKTVTRSIPVRLEAQGEE